ncbi:MAG: trigger factor [Spirochaetaceae bacterium]|nr:trigger factor [Spirochaetaceae bacterium]
MAAIKEVKKIEHSAARLTITLSQDEVQTEYTKYLANLLKDIQLPGFRRGKVPRTVLERKAGEALREEALNHIIGETTSAFFKGDSLDKKFAPLPFSDPQVEGAPQLDLEHDLEYSVTYDIAPEVTLGKCEGFEIEVADAELSDADVARELEEIRERNAIVLDRAAGEPSQKGDVITTNYALVGENGIIAGSEREDFTFELGSGRNIYQFDDKITGMKAGEEREFEKSWPANFKDASLAGTTKKIHVKVTAVKKKDLPELDDEFAQDVDEKYATLTDLKKDIRIKLQKQLDERLELLRNNEILKKIREASTIELPESMLHYEIGNDLYQMTGQFPAEGLKPLLENNKDLMNQLRPNAEIRLRNMLILEKLAEEHHIEVSESDLEAEYSIYAKNVNEEEAHVREFFKNDARKTELKRIIRDKKLFSILSSKNQLKKKKKVAYLDLFS